MHTPAFVLGVWDQAEVCSVWSFGGAALSRTDWSVAHTPATRAASHRRTMRGGVVGDDGVRVALYLRQHRGYLLSEPYGNGIPPAVRQWYPTSEVCGQGRWISPVSKLHCRRAQAPLGAHP